MITTRYYFSEEFAGYKDLFLKYNPKHKTFSPGEYMCSPSEMLDNVFFIESGLTRLSVLTDQNTEKLFCFFGPNSIYPVVCHMQNLSLEPYILLQAVTETKTFYFKTKYIAAIIMEHPEIGCAMIDHYVHFSNTLIVSDIFNRKGNAFENICQFLFLFAINSPEQLEQGSIPLSQEQLADATSLSRSQVIRILQKLKEENVIKTSRNYIKIIDLQKLKNKCPSFLQA